MFLSSASFQHWNITYFEGLRYLFNAIFCDKPLVVNGAIHYLNLTLYHGHVHCSQAHVSIRILFILKDLFHEIAFSRVLWCKRFCVQAVWVIINQHWSLCAVQSGETNRGTREHEVRFNSLWTDIISFGAENTFNMMEVVMCCEDWSSTSDHLIRGWRWPSICG